MKKQDLIKLLISGALFSITVVYFNGSWIGSDSGVESPIDNNMGEGLGTINESSSVVNNTIDPNIMENQLDEIPNELWTTIYEEHIAIYEDLEYEEENLGKEETKLTNLSLEPTLNNNGYTLLDKESNEKINWYLEHPETKKLYKGVIPVNSKQLEKDYQEIDNYLAQFRGISAKVYYTDENGQVNTKWMLKNEVRESMRELTNLWHIHGGDNFYVKKVEDPKSGNIEYVKTFVQEEVSLNSTGLDFVSIWKGPSYLEDFINFFITSSQATDELTSPYQILKKTYGDKKLAAFTIESNGVLGIDVEGNSDAREIESTYALSSHFAAKAYIFGKEIEFASLDYFNLSTCEIDEEVPLGTAIHTYLLGYKVPGEFQSNGIIDENGYPTPFYIDQCLHSLEEIREAQSERDDLEDSSRAVKKHWDQKSFCIPFKVCTAVTLELCAGLQRSDAEIKALATNYGGDSLFRFHGELKVPYYAQASVGVKPAGFDLAEIGFIANGDIVNLKIDIDTHVATQRLDKSSSRKSDFKMDFDYLTADLKVFIKYWLPFKHRRWDHIIAKSKDKSVSKDLDLLKDFLGI